MTPSLRCIALVLILALAGTAITGPTRGWDSRRRFRLEPGQTRVSQASFRGGERACILIEGDHQPEMKISVRVIDLANQQVVAADTGVDYCCAIWYPPRDRVYQIEIAIHGTVWNNCRILLK